MPATVATVTVAANNLREGDTFDYSGGTVTVVEVSRLDDRLVEVTVRDEYDLVRFLDHGVQEDVQVTGGPSFAIVRVAQQPQQADGPSATQRAASMSRRGMLKGEPASATLVLLALAAACDDNAGIAHEGSVAAVAGLSASTVRGYLRTLARKGMVRTSALGWTVAP